MIDNVWKGSNTADIDEVRTNGENLSPLHSGLRSGAVRQARRFTRWWRRRRGSLGKAFTATIAIATRCLLKRLAVLPQAFEAAENAALVAVKASRSLSVTLGDVLDARYSPFMERLESSEHADEMLTENARFLAYQDWPPIILLRIAMKPNDCPISEAT